MRLRNFAVFLSLSAFPHGNLFAEPNGWIEADLAAYGTLTATQDPGSRHQHTLSYEEQNGASPSLTLGLRFPLSFLDLTFSYQWQQLFLPNGDTLVDSFKPSSQLGYPNMLSDQRHHLSGTARIRFYQDFFAGIYSDASLLRKHWEDLEWVTTREYHHVPWLSWRWHESQESFFFLIFRRRLEPANPEATFQTVHNSLSDFSGGVGHISKFFAKFEVFGTLSRERLIFNDPYLDQVKLGGIFAVKYNPFSPLSLSASVGLFKHSFLNPLKKKGCGQAEEKESFFSFSDLMDCPRSELESTYRVQVTWAVLEGLFLSGRYYFLENQDLERDEFQGQERKIELAVTWQWGLTPDRPPLRGIVPWYPEELQR